MSNFIHFGCWNNLNKGCLEKVMQLLQKRLKNAAKPKIDFLTIAGDNYYPKKKEVAGKKKKIIFPGLLNKGFKYLPTEIPIYMILGNHDLETNTGNTSNFFIGDINDHEVNKPVEKDDCSIIKYEKMSKNKNGNIEYNLFKEFMLENGTLILMIDTSMYSEDVGKYLPCYNVFLDKEYTVEELRAYQLDLIMKTLTKYNDGEIKNLIIIGHHPIIGLKIKKEDDSSRINDIILFDNVLKEIYSRLNDTVNYFYLCADVHLYQEGDIFIKIDDIQTMMIKQYIVGTGGTELDKCANVRNIGVAINDDPRLTYTMTKCEERCGFLECINTQDINTQDINTQDSLSFVFNAVPIEGGRKQSKKSRKQKKSKRKRIIKSKKRKKSRRKTIRVLG